MERKQFFMIVMLVAMMAVFTGCSSKKNEEAVPQTGTGTTAETAADQSTLTGVVDEIKDFMFVVVDEDDNAYALPFGDEKPEGLEEIQIGDKVTVTYTGELTSVDPFKGEIISVEKVK